MTKAEQETIVSAGIDFMKTITDIYGAESGIDVWNNIADNVGSDFKGAVFFTLLAGGIHNEITLTEIDHANAITSIKAIRTATGLGLKDAKDAFDKVRGSGHPVKLSNHTAFKRHEIISILREAKCNGH